MVVPYQVKRWVSAFAFLATLIGALLVASGPALAQAQFTLTKTPSPTTYTAANQVIAYTYVITNNQQFGFGHLDSLVDDKVTSISCPGSSIPANGGTLTCTGSYTITAADVTAGSVTNTATATIDPCSDGCTRVTPQAQATVTFAGTPSWTLTKTPSPTTYTGAGQPISYSYLLTNTGPVTINSIAIGDNKIASVSCPATTLAPTAQMTCTGSYTTTTADVTAGSVTNTATATGTPTSGTLAPATAQATITFLAQPSWTLAKTPNPTTYTKAGQAIAYSYLLTNTGNVTINSIAIGDNKIATVSCPATTLAPTAQMTCTGSYTITAADVTAGSVTNTATANGTPTGGTLAPATAQATITFVAQPSWTLGKTPSPVTFSQAGQVIAYSYLLTNTGNVTINAIAIGDNKVSSVSCPATTLAPNAQLTCTGSYTTTAADVTAGSVTNTATATGTPAGGTLAPATAQATITFLAQPSWTLVKTPTPAAYTRVGQVITYSYLLTNTGSVTINSITVSDNKVATVNCPATTLAASAQLTCTGSYTITNADVIAGSVTNTATAKGIPTSGTLPQVTATATITFQALPSWILAKTPNPATYTQAGQVITYSYVLTNIGNVTINSIAIADNKVASVTCQATALPPGANTACTGSYTITAADIAAGSVTNKATATGIPASGTLTPATAQATITFNAQPAWTLTKTPSPTIYNSAGVVVTYTYLLTNTGNVTINSIAIGDNKVTSVSCPSSSLAAGTSINCSGTYTTTAADVTAGSVTNTATATGTPTGGTLSPATAQATITFQPPPVLAGTITIVKVAQGGNESFNFNSTIPGIGSFALVTIGGTISHTFTNVTPGNYTISEVNLPLNWKLASLSCTGDTNNARPTTVDPSTRTASIGLDSGESITCTFTNFFDVVQHQLQTQAVIQRFLAHRLQLLTDNEPDRSRFIRRFPGSLWGEDTSSLGSNVGESAFSVSGNSSALASQMSFSTSLSRIAQAHADAEAKQDPLLAYARAAGKPQTAAPKAPALGLTFDVWVEAHYSEYRANDFGVSNSGHFGVVYVGADFMLTPSILVGALVQYDWMTERSRTLATAADGQGPMVGPYVSVRLAPNLFFDARAAWGTSENNVNPFGVYQDAFTTSRWLARANLTGNWRFGDFRLTPSAGVTYIEDKQQSYTDRLGVLIPGQTVSLGRFDVGPEVAYRYTTAGGAVFEPHVALKGVWDFHRPDANAAGTSIVSGDALHARVQAGIMGRDTSGWSFRTVFTYDGLGSKNFHDMGGQLWLNIPLH